MGVGSVPALHQVALQVAPVTLSRPPPEFRRIKSADWVWAGGVVDIDRMAVATFRAGGGAVTDKLTCMLWDLPAQTDCEVQDSVTDAV